MLITRDTQIQPADDASTVQFAVTVPAGYARTDMLAFHSRDPAQLAEQVSAERIRKGVVINEMPVAIDIDLSTLDAQQQARCTAMADGPLSGFSPGQLRSAAEHIVRNMMGLYIDPQGFADFVRDDPLLGPLTLRQRDVRVVQSATIFEALTWAIIGQQINVPFAISLRHTFIRLAGRTHSSGIWCYPSPADACRIAPEALTSRQFSRAKAETILRLAQRITRGELDLQVSEDNPIGQICTALLAVKGIGPWTVNYALLRGYAYPDCSLHGDVAVRTALQRLTGSSQRPTIAEAETLLNAFQPHRTMAAAHLWASLHKRDA